MRIFWFDRHFDISLNRHFLVRLFVGGAYPTDNRVCLLLGKVRAAITSGRFHQRSKDP